jgi:hypothetical protein
MYNTFVREKNCRERDLAHWKRNVQYSEHEDLYGWNDIFRGGIFCSALRNEHYQEHLPLRVHSDADGCKEATCKKINASVLKKKRLFLYLLYNVQGLLISLRAITMYKKYE